MRGLLARWVGVWARGKRVKLINKKNATCT